MKSASRVEYFLTSSSNNIKHTQYATNWYNPIIVFGKTLVLEQQNELVIEATANFAGSRRGRAKSDIPSYTFHIMLITPHSVEHDETIVWGEAL